MGIVSDFDQLHVHTHAVAAPLHTSFQDVSNPKLLADLGQVFRRTFVMLRGSARDYFQVGALGYPRRSTHSRCLRSGFRMAKPRSIARSQRKIALVDTARCRLRSPRELE